MSLNIPDLRISQMRWNHLGLWYHDEIGTLLEKTEESLETDREVSREAIGDHYVWFLLLADFHPLIQNPIETNVHLYFILIEGTIKHYK